MFINSDENNVKFKTDISQGIKSGQEVKKVTSIDDNTNEQLNKNKKQQLNTVVLQDVIVKSDTRSVTVGGDSRNLKDKINEKMIRNIKSMDLKNANMNEIEDIIKNKKNIIKEPK